MTPEEQKALKAQFEITAREISDAVTQIAGKEELLAPALAICGFKAFQKLQQGDENDQLAAQKWLRSMWDSIDATTIQPAFHGQKPKEVQASIMANYILLEGYFSGHGDVTKELRHVERVMKEHGFVPDERIDAIVIKLANLISGVTRLGGWVG